MFERLFSASSSSLSICRHFSRVYDEAKHLMTILQLSLSRTSFSLMPKIDKYAHHHLFYCHNIKLLFIQVIEFLRSDYSIYQNKVED